MPEDSSNDPNISRERTVSCPEHEVWLSFPSDNGAATFNDWWHLFGLKLWRKYHEQNKADYE